MFQFDVPLLKWPVMACVPLAPAVAVNIAAAQLELAAWLTTLANVSPVAVGTENDSPALPPSLSLPTTIKSPVAHVTLADALAVPVPAARPKFEESVGAVVAKHGHTSNRNSSNRLIIALCMRQGEW
jgi:hypothetical protein